MKKSTFTLFLASFFLCFVQLQAQTFNITNYGAVGDGTTLNTQSVQKAIDACFKAGGGKVIIPTGVFLIGTIYLKSNINLYFEGRSW